MKIYFRWALVLISFVGMIGCGEEDSEKIIPTTAVSPGFGSPDVTPLLASVTEIFDAGEQLFGSIPLTSFGLVANECENGEPSNIDSSSEGYPSALFECKAASDSGSPDTIRGSLGTLRMVFCAFEKKFPNGIEYTSAGTDLVAAAGGSIEVEFTLDCFPQNVIDEMVADLGSDKMNLISATAYKLDLDTTGYTNQLTFVADFGADGEEEWNSTFFVTDTTAGFKTIGHGEGEGKGGVTMVTMDFASGSVLYNTIDDRNGAGGADSRYRRNVRMKVEGTINQDDFTFSEISGMQGIYAQSSSSESYANLDSGAMLATIKGTSTAYKGYAANYYQGAVSQLSESCTPVDADCAGVTGLEIDSDSLTFYKSNDSWPDFIQNGFPLCDGGDISYAAVPVHLGKAGNCE